MVRVVGAVRVNGDEAVLVAGGGPGAVVEDVLRGAVAPVWRYEDRGVFGEVGGHIDVAGDVSWVGAEVGDLFKVGGEGVSCVGCDEQQAERFEKHVSEMLETAGGFESSSPDQLLIVFFDRTGVVYGRDAQQLEAT